MQDITVYAKPRCVQCDATKRALTSAGVAYDVVDVTEDAAALAKIKALGYAQVPVVIAGQDHWGGFRPDRIKALARPPRKGSRGRTTQRHSTREEGDPGARRLPH